MTKSCLNKSSEANSLPSMFTGCGKLLTKGFLFNDDDDDDDDDDNDDDDDDDD